MADYERWAQTVVDKFMVEVFVDYPQHFIQSLYDVKQNHASMN